MSEVKWAETQDRSEWDDFVAEHHGSIFHQWAWRRVLESDGSKPLYLVCRDGSGKTVALCPFFYRSGRRLVYLDSLPESHTAGPIIDEEASNSQGIIASMRKSMKFTPFNPVAAMRIRTVRREAIEPMLRLRFKHETTYGLLLIDLQAETPEEIWLHGFQKHDRQAVKYYDQDGKGFQLSGSEDDYERYLSLQRGSIIHGNDLAAYVSRLRQHLGDDLKVASVRLGDEVVGGALMLCDRPGATVHLSIMRFSPARNIHSAVTYLDWEVTNWAHKNGFRYIDLGGFDVAGTSKPGHPFYKLRNRFKAAFVLRYQFVLPTSDISYSIAKHLSRVF